MSDISVKKLMAYAEILDDVFRIYIEDITPFVIRFEIENAEFPIEVQNEIRAMFNHMARAALADDDEQIKRNIEKMRSHAKRALLDCFKCISIICEDNYVLFMKQYENVDLTLINEGRFLTNIKNLRNSAVDAMKKAKKAESLNTSENDLFNLYQIAYMRYEELSYNIHSAETTVEYLYHKAAKRDRIAKWSLYLGVIGTIIGIAGFIVGFIK